MSEAQTEAFWTYGAKVYARPGVAEIVLALQDQDGANVNVLLLCAWLAESETSVLTISGLHALLTACAPWNAHVTKPLRAARRALKSASGEIAEPAQALRIRVKADELEAERLEQRLMVSALWNCPDGLVRHEGPSEHAVRASLDRYVALLPPTEDGMARDARIKDFIKTVFV